MSRRTIFPLPPQTMKPGAGTPALPVASGTNQQFVTMPDYVLDELGKKYGFAYLRREDPSHSTVRFCTSWATREEDVRELMADIGRLC